MTYIQVPDTELLSIATPCNHQWVPPSSSNAAQQYIAALRTAHSLGNHTAETTFYPPFANLLNTIGERLKPRIHFQAHPGTHGAGLADGGLFPLSRTSQREPLPNQLPERGAVEIKPPGTNLPTLAQSAQVRRYLQTYGLCLITNYHQFQLLELRNDQPYPLESYDLTTTADDLWNLPLHTLNAEHAETLPALNSLTPSHHLQLISTRRHTVGLTARLTTHLKEQDEFRNIPTQPATPTRPDHIDQDHRPRVSKSPHPMSASAYCRQL